MPPVSGSASRTRRTIAPRSEEHTSELQSHLNLVCRLLLEKKKQQFAIKPYDHGVVLALNRHGYRAAPRLKRTDVEVPAGNRVRPQRDTAHVVRHGGATRRS